MSFYFANQSENKNKNKKGRKLLYFMSLQLKTSTTDCNQKYTSDFSHLISPNRSLKSSCIFRKAKRTFLSAHLDGSVTVEAAFVLPLFIFAMISIMYLFNLIYIQLVMQIQLENTARIVCASTCVTTTIDANLDNDENVDSILEEGIKKIVMDAAGTIAVKELFLSDDIRTFADNSLIVDGSEGLSFYGSTVTNTASFSNITLTYKARMPFIPEDVFTFNLINKCYFKAFSGKELKNNVDFREIYVYIAKNGSVFHLNRLCSYLERYTHLCNEELLKKEYPYIKLCTLCKQGNNLFTQPQLNGISYVYVTDDFDAYHITEACPYLNRYILRIPYDAALDAYKPCIRCVPSSE